ncbi:uncharacterized protein LOC144433076 [Glandiceps talaboti]
MVKRAFFCLSFGTAIFVFIFFHQYLVFDVPNVQTIPGIFGKVPRTENVSEAMDPDGINFTGHFDIAPETTSAVSHAQNEDDKVNGKPVTNVTEIMTVKQILQSHELTNGLSQEIRRKMANRYLFAVVNFDGGPNFQYQQFIYSIFMALNTNRTIVLGDFSRHRKGPMNSDVVLFNETFDSDVFKEFIPTTSIEEFRATCGSHIKNVLVLPTYRNKPFSYVTADYDMQRKWLSLRAGITIPDMRVMPRTNTSIQNMFKKLEDEMCVVMISPESFRDTVHPPTEEITQSLYAHLIRTPFLRKTVSELMPELCNGGPVLAFHWRNKTGEICRIRNMTCDGNAETQERMLEMLSRDMKEIQRKNSINCVFVAYSQEESQHFINIFKTYNPNVITMDDVINLRNPGIESYNGDDYFISLIEQEICARSEVFIGNGRSNWSVFIFRERKVYDRGPTYDIMEDFPSISDIVMDGYK